MDISIGNLTVTNFCENNIEHIKFKKELLNDRFMCHFFPDMKEEEFLLPCGNINQIQLGHYYLVEDADNLVGWFYLKGVDKYCALDCGIHPHYRKKGYGTLILQECRDYLFEKDITNEIELMIKNTNAGALACAKKAKYKKLGKVDCFYIYGSCKEDNHGYNIRTDSK